MRKVLTNFLKMYCDPAALVVVVNASDYEEVSNQHLYLLYYYC